MRRFFRVVKIEDQRPSPYESNYKCKPDHTHTPTAGWRASWAFASVTSFPAFVPRMITTIRLSASSISALTISKFFYIETSVTPGRTAVCLEMLICVREI